MAGPGENKEPSALDRLAANVKALRERSGLSTRELADKLGWNNGHLHKMENGHTRGSEALIDALVTYYDAPYLKDLWVLAKLTPVQDEYERYMSLEAKATLMWQYSPSIVPGLLQTEGYARELLKASGLFGDDLDDQVSWRLDRQKKILADEDPAEYRAIIDEAALMCCPLPDRDEWIKQLAHLVEMAERPNVTIQVLRRESGLHGLTNTDTMFVRLPKGSSVAYTETGYSGDLVEDPKEVARLLVRYDRLRDMALSPRESLAFIKQQMEDMQCEPPSET